MKPLLKILVFFLIGSPVTLQAQFTTKIPSNTSIKTGVDLSNFPKLTLGKTTLEHQIFSIPEFCQNKNSGCRCFMRCIISWMNS